MLKTGNFTLMNYFRMWRDRKLLLSIYQMMRVL